jgi:hypothetical protein
MAVSKDGRNARVNARAPQDEAEWVRPLGCDQWLARIG